MTPTKVQLPFAAIIHTQDDARPVLQNEPRFDDGCTEGQLSSELNY